MHPADKQIIEHFEHVRDTTIELFERVPDGLLGRVPEGMPDGIGLEFYHIAVSTNWFMDTAIGDAVWEAVPGYSDRARLLELLLTTRERPRALLSASPELLERESTIVFDDGRVYTHNGRDWLLTTIDHEVSHRGRLTLALRQMGFTDFPVYRYT